MTTTATGMPPMRLFTPQECEALVSVGIIAEGEQADVLAGARLFNVDEYLDMEKAGILHEDDRVELMDGKIIVMAPIGDSHVFGADWLNMLLVPHFAGRAMVARWRPNISERPQRPPTRCCGGKNVPHS